MQTQRNLMQAALDLEIAVKASATLRQLADALNAIDDAPPEVSRYVSVDYSRLPVYSDPWPADTEGVFSWDADHLLVPDSRSGRGYVIVQREEVQS